MVVVMVGCGGPGGRMSCVAVCVRPIDSVVCVHLFGVLHSSVALQLSVVVVLSGRSAGVTQEGFNTVCFPSFCVSSLPHIPPAVLAFTSMARRVQSSHPLVHNDVDGYVRLIYIAVISSIISTARRFSWAHSPSFARF